MLQINKKHFPFLMFFFMTSLMSFIMCVIRYNSFSEGYKNVFCLPLSFMIMIVVLYKMIVISRYKVTMSCFAFFQYIRLTITPFFICMAEIKNHLSYGITEAKFINNAILLMVYEFLFSTVVLAFFLKHSNNKYKNKELKLKGNNYAYIAFIIIALIIYLYYLKSGIKLVNFIALDTGTGQRLGDETNTVIVLSRQFIILGLIFLFVTTTSYCKQKYEKTHKTKYVNIAIVSALINICTIIGERRSAQIFSAACCSYILVKVFPKYKNKILKLICGSAFVILAIMSIYKFSYAFLYDSYYEAMKSNSLDVNEFAEMLQSYFAGPNNIALGMAFKDKISVSPFHFVFDTLRSIVPISFLLKGSGQCTSVLFNNAIYHGAQNSGHVLSALSYGYIYGGYVLSPMFTALNLIISIWIERMIIPSKSYEMSYILLFCLFKFTINYTANTPALLSSSTIIVFTGGIVFLVAKFINECRRNC